MSYARIEITPEFLVEILCLPHDTRVVDAGMKHSHGVVVLTVAHPDLKTVALSDGELPPLTRPAFRRQEPVVFVGWGQD